MKFRRIFTSLFFLMMAFWLFFLLQGLVIGDQDDWDHYVGAYEMSWPEALGNFLTPWSKSTAWSGFADVDDQVLYRRVFPTVLYKTLQLIPIPMPFLFYLVFKGIFFGAVLVILFRFLKQVTASESLSLFAVLVYVLMPVHYMQLFWLSDYAVNILGFMMLGIWAYLKFLNKLESNQKGKSIYGWLAIIVICGFLGMRTRDTAILLPLILGTHFLFRYRLWNKYPYHALFFFLALGFIVFQLVPLEHVQTAQRFPTQFQWENVSRMVLRNYNNQYENEPVSAFFSTESILPVSMARTIGFFPLWTIVLFAILALLRRGEKQGPLHPVLQLSLIWLVIEIPLMGLYSPEPRYFSGVMTPLTLAITALFASVFRSLRFPWNKISMGFAAAVFLFQGFGVNLSHIFFLKTQREVRYYQMHEAAKAVYRDHFQTDKFQLVDLARFYCLHCARESYQGVRLDHLIYHSDIGLGHWLRPEKDLLASDLMKTASLNRPYIISKNSELDEKNPLLRSLQSIPGFNPESLFYQSCLRFKKKKPPTVTLYKIGVTPYGIA